MMAAALGLAEMFVGASSAEVLVVASDQRQANITLKYARRMVELNPLLSERVQVYADRLYLPENDATLLPLPAEPGALHGHDPSLQVVDELHVVTEEVWEAVTSVAGKRPESLTLAISTPAASPDSVMWQLVEHGRRGDDPAFYFREYSAPEGCAVDDRKAWRIGNPALACRDPFLAEDGVEAALRTIREVRVPTATPRAVGDWGGVVAAVGSLGRLPHRARRSSLASVSSWRSTGPHPVTPPPWSAPRWTGICGSRGCGRTPAILGWRVPREIVSNAVDVAFAKYDVVELACDPWGWRSEIEAWAQRHGERRVIEWNTAHGQRMAPATDRLYQAVVTKAVTHDGDSRMAAHIAHCVAKRTPMGDLVSKDKRGSPRKIDAAVAAIVAYDRAAWHLARNRKRTRSFAS